MVAFASLLRREEVESYLNMQTLIDYFKSPIGILKVFAVLLIATVVTLSCYSHFESHWIHHDERNKVYLNEYEACMRFNPIFREGPAIYCPSPAFDIVLIATASAVLFLSVLFLILICNLMKPIPQKVWCQIKCYEVAFHSLCALFLLLGGILFILSAYYISDWCEQKFYLSEGIRTVPRPRMHHDDIAVVRTVELQDNVDTNVNTGIGILSDNEKVPVRALIPVEPQERHIIVRDANTNINNGNRYSNGVEELCKTLTLVTEKYWAGGTALLAALIYAILAVMIWRNAKESEVGCFGGTATPQSTQTDYSLQKQQIRRKCRNPENSCADENRNSVGARDESTQA